MNMLFILRVQSITSKSKIQAYNGQLGGRVRAFGLPGIRASAGPEGPDLKTLKVIPDQDSEHFNFYLSHIISEEMGKNWINHWELAVQSDVDSLVDKITSETGMEASSRSLRAFLKTPLDNEVEFFSRPRRRNLVGRIRKQHADLCLMSGSRIDAIGLYELSGRNQQVVLRVGVGWSWIRGLGVRDFVQARVSRRQYQHASSKLQDAARVLQEEGNARVLGAECLLRLGRLCVNYDRPRVYQTLQRCHALSNEFAYRRGSRRGRGVEGGRWTAAESRFAGGLLVQVAGVVFDVGHRPEHEEQGQSEVPAVLGLFLREVAPHVAAWPEGRVGRAGWAQRVDSILTSVTLNSAPVERR
ncbi:uncharacterized protein LOC126332404 [Schistocerca gregaria]|uniref:uncharacterized protein LOC126332404 n=1 Tax=Schistocerca gregaria TaxID=7010 RepID=UPI00211F146E|nr:uncharacterized protein LOC126332404 [Schistocerca gregaria]